MALIRGTTPTIIFTFTDVLVSDISKAYLVIKQSGASVIEKDISSATVGEDVRWTLEQEDTLSLKRKINADIYCDWLLNDGTRGRSKIQTESVEDSGIDEVI